MLKICIKKHQYLINKREDKGLRTYNDSKASVEYLSDINNI